MKRCPTCGKRFPDEAAFCARDGARLVAERRAKPDPLVGRELLGRYRVLERIDRGGFGTVYAVEKLGLGRREALKVLHLRELAGLELTPDERRKYERWLHSDFLHERTALVWLERARSPHIAGIYDGGVLPAELLDAEADRPFFTMEYIEGPTLRRVVERERGLDVRRAVRLLRQVCEALRVAHELEVPAGPDGEMRRGIVHRDLKLENVMVTAVTGEETAKVVDFGVAKVVGADPTERSRTIRILTPGCAAPEQMDGDAEPAVDLFALGVLGYELLTGHEPWAGRSLREGTRLSAEEARQRIQKARHLEPVPLEAFRDDLPAGLRDAIHRLLEKQPENRFPSARSTNEALAEVEAGLAGGPRRPPPPPETEIVPPEPERAPGRGSLFGNRRALAGAGGAVVLTVLSLWAFSSRGTTPAPDAPFLEPTIGAEAGAAELVPEAGAAEVVPDPGPARMDITPSRVLLFPWRTTQLAVEVLDASGRAMPYDAIEWRSSDSTVARVSGAGVVVGRRVGEATITARAGDAEATAEVRVWFPRTDRPPNLRTLQRELFGAGTVVGTVVSDATGRPMPMIPVAIGGTDLGARTDSLGRYRIENVPHGTVHVVVRPMFYARDSVRADLARGQTLTVDFRLKRGTD